MQNAWLGNNLKYDEICHGAWSRGHWVTLCSPTFLFQFLSQNIDKIKRAALHVLSNLVFTPYFRHDLDCSRVKHFAIFWETIWLNILQIYQRVGFCWGSMNNHFGINLVNVLWRLPVSPVIAEFRWCSRLAFYLYVYYTCTKQHFLVREHSFWLCILWLFKSTWKYF